MSLLDIASGKLDRLVGFFGRLASWLLIILAMVITSDVLLRKWFVIGSTRLQELEWHLHGALFLLTIGWAYTRDQHVRIELVQNRLGETTKAWIELAGCLLFLLPYTAAIIWFGYDYAALSYAYNETSASPSGLPYRWIIKSVLVFGFVLLGLAGISRSLKSIQLIVGRGTSGS